MAGLMDKLSGVFFREQEEENYFAQEENDVTEPVVMPNERNLWREQEPVLRSKKAQITAIPTRNEANMEMVLIKATSYDDMQVIAKHIKAKKVVVVNFEDIDKAVAQRMVDFLSGAVFALNGAPKKVSGGTFIFSSDAVALSGHIMDEDAAKDNAEGFSWRNRK